VSARHVYDLTTWHCLQKTTYNYDSTGIDAQATTATGHDQSYVSSSSVRGNLTEVSAWDANDMSNPATAHTSHMTYDAAGNVIASSDPLGHQTTLAYADSFSDNTNHNTFAYPTLIKDPDWNASTAPNNYSTIEYKYELGATTRVQGPPAAGQSVGAKQSFEYDAATRLIEIDNVNNGAVTHFGYGPNYIYTFGSVNSPWDNYSFRLFDGLGRVIATPAQLPNGNWATQLTEYDVMGRVSKQSNPAEMDGNWNPIADDAAGWVYTQQTYDWKGRPVLTTNTDGTQKYASYAGCGCAGGEVVTLTDEVGRQQKIYSDAVGRQVKFEVLNWNGSVYSATTNTLNALDQVINIRQTDNATGNYQDTTMSYDGYGRLETKHVPEQDAGTNTTYAFNPDDTILSVTDARGASATYGYNNGRHLVTSTTYSAPSGISVPAAASFEYDAAGNRTSMSDGTGSISYSFDQLSRLSSETRTFAGLSGSYSLNYQYNLAGELKKITDPTNATINYDYDSTGRVVGVTGENTLIENVSTYAWNLAYRAWGGLKDVDYGNSTHSHLNYNSRLLPTSLSLSNVLTPPFTQATTMNWSYDYFDDGSNHHALDLADNHFDRAQEYDQVGRVKEAYSGREASGLSPTTPIPDSPYRQTMQYDVWDNLTAKSGRLWRQSLSDSFAYTNNRGPSWRMDYDAAGNMVRDEAKYHYYDAANQQTQFIDWSKTVGGGQTGHDPAPAIEIAQAYDTANRPAKRVETRRADELIGDGPQTNIATTATTTYYLYSSVLGGAEVVELDGNGVKTTGYVYANGQRLAKQTITQSIGTVIWNHPNAGSNSWVETSSARYATRQEMDPVGAEVGTSDPYVSSPSPSYASIKGSEPLFIDGSDPFDYSSSVTIDGLPATQSQLNHIQRDLGVSQVMLFDVTVPFGLMPDHPNTISVPIADTFGIAFPGFGLTWPDRQRQKGGTQDPAKIVDKSIDQAAQLLTKEPCWNFVHDVLGVNDPDGIPGLLRSATRNTYPTSSSATGTWVHAETTYDKNGIGPMTVDYYKPFFTDTVPKPLESGHFVLSGQLPTKEEPATAMAQGQDSLHEGIHGWTKLNDFELAKLVNPKKSFKTQLEASEFWNKALRAKCNGVGKDRPK
jgi:YD repeat-containing protein